MPKLEEAIELRRRAETLASDIDAYHERHKDVFSLNEGPLVSITGGRALYVANLARKVEREARGA